MNRVMVSGLIALWSCSSVAHSWSLAQQDEPTQSKPTRPAIRRAARPTFTPRETELLFFRDAFSQALVGERPENLTAVAAAARDEQADSTSRAAEGTTTARYNWSKVISPESLEGEVKRLNGVIDQVVTTPRRFASGGYRDARLHFSMLAMLFAIISEYDGEVKWQDHAPIARDLFAKMAANATAGSQAVYNQAKLRKEDLMTLVSGGKLSAPGDFEPQTDWLTVVDRPPLMERIEIGLADRLKPWTSRPGDFQDNKDALRREAALFAAIAEVLTRDGLPDADQEGYVVYAHEMRDAALQIVQAIENDDYDTAATASSLISQACQNCHADWQ